ncbi:MAG: hypothetical protein ACJ74S_03755, partial [Gaiellaceae bacterium]
LIESGREHGTLTPEYIALAFDELDLDTGQLDEFYAALEELQRVGRGRGAAVIRGVVVEWRLVDIVAEHVDLRLREQRPRFAG